MTLVTLSKIFEKSYPKIRRPQWECCTFALDNEVKCDCGLRLSIARASSALHSPCTVIAVVIRIQIAVNLIINPLKFKTMSQKFIKKLNSNASFVSHKRVENRD